MKNHSTLYVSLLSMLLGWHNLTIQASDIEEPTISVERLYQDAELAHANGSYHQAIDLYKQVKIRYFSSPYAEQAHLGMIDSYIASHRLAEAQTELASFIRLYYPNTKYFIRISDIQEMLKKQNNLQHKQKAGWFSARSLVIFVSGIAAGAFGILSIQSR